MAKQSQKQVIKKISTNDLVPGHYVDSIAQNWFSTPFLFHRFKVKSQKDIQKLIENGIKEVYIDTEKGLDIAQDEVSEICTGMPINYIEVPVDRLMPGTVIPFSLYVKEGDGFAIYLKHNIPLHSEIIYDIQEHNIQTLYIDERERALLDEYLKGIEYEKELSRNGLAKGFETNEKILRYNDYLAKYIPIDPSILISGLKIPFPIFIGQNSQVSLLKQTRCLTEI